MIILIKCMKKTTNKKQICLHDYKNAVLVGRIDRMCPLCKELIDPNEWFLITHLESLGAHFVEVKPEKTVHVSPKAHHYNDK